ncbi:hypothetical protein D910_12668 [Dendroctonus ponderosae]
MASKVIAKLPVAPFGQVNKTKSGAVSSELIVPKLQEVQRSDDEASRAPEQVRLEQNIRFLQDQHQLMLAGLHGEIEKLKARNRDLQFQLIFGKPPTASTPASSSPSPSSPEEETRSKLYTSPQSVTNSTPLQIELLEKELGELKIQMQEQESRNLYLSAIVDEQKKKLERYDRRVEKEQQRTGGAGDPEAELRRKLEDADAVVRLLRRENSDLRRENQGMSEAAVHIPQVAHSHQHNRENGLLEDKAIEEAVEEDIVPTMDTIVITTIEEDGFRRFISRIFGKEEGHSNTNARTTGRKIRFQICPIFP